ELGIGQDGPADRQHFALTSRKCSCRLLEALSELREPCEHLIDRRPLSVRERTHLEVLAHAQSAKDGMLLRHVAQTRTNPTLGWQPRDVLTIQRDAPAAGCKFADNCLEQRGLAGAVATQHCHGAAARRRQSYVEQHLTEAV